MTKKRLCDEIMMRDVLYLNSSDTLWGGKTLDVKVYSVCYLVLQYIKVYGDICDDYYITESDVQDQLSG